MPSQDLISSTVHAYLLNVLARLVQAGLFSIFSAATEQSPGFVRALGPGGHFMVAALLRLVARQLVCSIPSSELQLDISEEPPALGRGAHERKSDKNGFVLPPPPAA